MKTRKAILTNRTPIECRQRFAAGRQSSTRKGIPNFLEFSRFFSQNNEQLARRESAMPDKIMTLKEVAEYLRLKEKTAYRHAAEGILPGFKVGGAWRFRKADIDAWIEKNKNSAQ